MDHSSNNGSTPGQSKKAYFWLENLILEKLVPVKNTGPIFRWIFKFPLLLDKCGLWFLIPNGILILTTKGRRTGKARKTPMEFGRVQPDGSYLVMSGWAGRTDWYKNALVEPQVTVKIGRKEFNAKAEPLECEEIAALLREVIQTNPASLRFFERWSGTVDPSPAGLRSAARYFPSLRLRPV
jgi:deazaflavin-dependent oxidoreductase (nitroreductase family)